LPKMATILVAVAVAVAIALAVHGLKASKYFTVLVNGLKFN